MSKTFVRAVDVRSSDAAGGCTDTAFQHWDAMLTARHAKLLSVESNRQQLIARISAHGGASNIPPTELGDIAAAIGALDARRPAPKGGAIMSARRAFIAAWFADNYGRPVDPASVHTDVWRRRCLFLSEKEATAQAKAEEEKKRKAEEEKKAQAKAAQAKAAAAAAEDRRKFVDLGALSFLEIADSSRELPAAWEGGSLQAFFDLKLQSKRSSPSASMRSSS
jgi:hypothetical protein